MPAKRALRLDVAAKSVHEQTPKKNRQGLSKHFSPTTGTCQLSPMLSPNVDKGADMDPAETELSNKEQTPTVKMGNYSLKKETQKLFTMVICYGEETHHQKKFTEANKLLQCIICQRDCVNESKSHHKMAAAREEIQNLKRGTQSQLGAKFQPAEILMSLLPPSGETGDEAEKAISLKNFMALHSRAEKSLAMFLKMRKSLKSLQAAEGSRELENIFGVSGRSQDLKAELKRTKELMLEVKKRKLMHASNANHP